LPAWAQLASIYADAGAGRELAPVVARLRRLDDGHPLTLYYAAAAEFLAGRLAEARAAAQAAVSADATRADAHNLLGAIEASAGNANQARSEFAAALAINPRDPATYTNLGTLELNHGNPAAARRWFAEALSLDPSSPAARDGLGRTRGR
jgi:Flp pilus assembly protein TadD